MPQIMSLSMRPKRLSELVGQKSLTDAMRKQVATRWPRAWMFIGQSGGGKTTLARIVALACQCKHQTVWGEPCDECWANFAGFQIAEINASEVKGVDEIGEIASSSRFRPLPPSTRRVFILDECQMMSSQAQNLLLKPTEDPPATTVWILCTTAPNKILPTLRRRFMQYQVKPLSIANREALLKRAAAKVKFTGNLDPLFEKIHMMQVSSPSLLLTALEKYISGLPADEAVCTLEVGGDNAFRIAKAVAAGNWNDLRANLKGTGVEECRGIRASVCGYLKGILLNESNPKRRVLISTSILELTAMSNATDDALLYPWLVAALQKVQARLQQ